MLIGYARVSTAEQNEQRQLVALREQKADKIFTDKASGKNTDRKALKEMLDYVREGDTVITESISRIARSTRDLLTIIDTLTQKKVEFISLKENIDTTTPQGRFMLTVFAALADGRPVRRELLRPDARLPRDFRVGDAQRPGRETGPQRWQRWRQGLEQRRRRPLLHGRRRRLVRRQLRRRQPLGVPVPRSSGSA